MAPRPPDGRRQRVRIRNARPCQIFLHTGPAIRNPAEEKEEGKSQRAEEDADLDDIGRDDRPDAADRGVNRGENGDEGQCRGVKPEFLRTHVGIHECLQISTRRIVGTQSRVPLASARVIRKTAEATRRVVGPKRISRNS